MECNDCDLYKTRTNIVEGDGNPNSDIMFIGEAPGRTEDDLGIPFIGAAGKILDELLKKVHLVRENIYITNIVKCRPPKNRNPTEKEIKACSKHLDNEIKIIKPKTIVPLGVFATKYVFNKYGIKFTSMTAARGTVYKVGDIRIVPMYHPASIIYNRNLQDIMFKDIGLVIT